MPINNLTRAALLMLLLVSASIISWEIYLRNKGFETSYNDDPALWANNRAMVYEPTEKATVFIGSSCTILPGINIQIKFNTG